MDIYDQEAKSDWKKFCNNSISGPQLAAATGVVSDVELGPTVSANDSKATEAASAQQLQESGHESTAPPAAAPAKKQFQSDSWRTMVEQMMSLRGHNKQEVSWEMQHAPADQHQSSSSQGFVEEEVKALQAAAAVGVTRVESQVTPRAAQGSSGLKRFLIERLFGALCSVSRATVRQRVEKVQTLELRVPVYL